MSAKDFLRGRRRAVVVCFVLTCALLCGFLFRFMEHDRVHSPDGRFYAVVACRAWRSYIPTNPGGGSDKPGHITVFARDGTSCGTVPVPMALMIQEIRWSTNTAHLQTIADWDLIEKEVHR